MNHHYRDIRDRIKIEPKWFDENAVPRYCTFKPRELANIYADECALVLIACQNCGHQFKVAFSQDLAETIRYSMLHGHSAKMPTLADSIKSNAIHYGDPPNIGCCAVGPTENCYDLKVLQYWKQDKLDWVRDRNLEIDLTGSHTLVDMIDDINATMQHENNAGSGI